MRETHISWVFLVGERAYKLKKPLVLPFLDYGTPERRRLMCHEEIRLNRRLADDIYLGVRGVVIDGDQASLTDEDDPEAGDFVVEMRRYDESRSLAARLARGELDRTQIAAVARALAAFHAGASPHPGTGDAAVTAEREIEANIHELFGLLDQHGEIDRVLALHRFAHAFIAAQEDELERRRRGGRVRDGHGDLRAEHVLVDGSVRVVDCVEFDPGLRRLDVADDLAFLVLDLAVHGGERFAELLLAEYRQAGGDPGEDALIAFYAVHRALVRAKVALVRAAELPARSAGRGAASAHARDLILLAERFAWRARLPLAILVCGVPASGKSHLAARLAESAGLPHLSSDLTRKRLLGVAATERAGADAYRPEASERAYRELAREAADAVAAHGGAIVDATFRHAAERAAFREAFGDGAQIVAIECVAPVNVLAARARQRERDPSRVSDADLEVVLSEAASWEPLGEVPAHAHVIVRTDRPVGEIVADVMALIDTRLCRL